LPVGFEQVVQSRNMLHILTFPTDPCDESDKLVMNCLRSDTEIAGIKIASSFYFALLHGKIHGPAVFVTKNNPELGSQRLVYEARDQIAGRCLARRTHDQSSLLGVRYRLDRGAKLRGKALCGSAATIA